MTQKELAVVLQNLNIRGRAYSLYGADYQDSYVLNQRGGGVWEVYYSERGSKNSLRSFVSESEACTYFYEWIKADNSIFKTS